MLALLGFSLMAHASEAPAAAPTASNVSMGFPTITVLIFVIAFIVSVLIDLWQHKNSEEITLANSVAWSIFWIVLSLGFYGWLKFGPPELVLGINADMDPKTAAALKAQQGNFSSLFITGYVLEKVLSVDNLIVFYCHFQVL